MIDHYIRLTNSALSSLLSTFGYYIHIFIVIMPSRVRYAIFPYNDRSFFNYTARRSRLQATHNKCPVVHGTIPIVIDSVVRIA